MDFINNIKSVFQTTDKIKWMDVSKIIIDPEFEGIFIQKETEIANICENMKENGFDPAHPIILAYSKDYPELNNINADGHTRYKAAIRAGLTKVAVIYKEFSEREELLKFVYEQQLLRRNLSESEIFKSWEALNHLTNKDGKKVKSDTEIAEELKISRRQVAKMKEVTRKAPAEIVEQVKAGELSVNKAYTQIKQKESKSAEIIVSGMIPLKEIEAENECLCIVNETYHNDFIEGFNYVVESLRYGKILRDLQNELAKLKAGTKSVEELQESLLALKDHYEQKQTE